MKISTHLRFNKIVFSANSAAAAHIFEFGVFYFAFFILPLVVYLIATLNTSYTIEPVHKFVRAIRQLLTLECSPDCERFSTDFISCLFSFSPAFPAFDESKSNPHTYFYWFKDEFTCRRLIPPERSWFWTYVSSVIETCDDSTYLSPLLLRLNLFLRST